MLVDSVWMALPDVQLPPVSPPLRRTHIREVLRPLPVKWGLWREIPSGFVELLVLFDRTVNQSTLVRLARQHKGFVIRAQPEPKIIMRLFHLSNHVSSRAPSRQARVWLTVSSSLCFGCSQWFDDHSRKMLQRHHNIVYKKLKPCVDAGLPKWLTDELQEFHGLYDDEIDSRLPELVPPALIESDKKREKKQDDDKEEEEEPAPARKPKRAKHQAQANSSAADAEEAPRSPSVDSDYIGFGEFDIAREEEQDAPKPKPAKHQAHANSSAADAAAPASDANNVPSSPSVVPATPDYSPDSPVYVPPGSPAHTDTEDAPPPAEKPMPKPVPPVIKTGPVLPPGAVPKPVPPPRRDQAAGPSQPSVEEIKSRPAIQAARRDTSIQGKVAVVITRLAPNILYRLKFQHDIVYSCRSHEEHGKPCVFVVAFDQDKTLAEIRDIFGEECSIMPGKFISDFRRWVQPARQRFGEFRRAGAELPYALQRALDEHKEPKAAKKPEKRKAMA
jgi:hypothetical protein